MVRPTFIGLNLEDVQYYPFIISINRCDGKCNTVEDLFDRICAPNKIDNVNWKVFNIVKGTNE